MGKDGKRQDVGKMCHPGPSLSLYMKGAGRAALDKLLGFSSICHSGSLYSRESKLILHRAV